MTPVPSLARALPAVLASVVLLGAGQPAGATPTVKPRQPEAPASGPGSLEYPYPKVRVTGGSLLPGQFALYEPDGPDGPPAQAPVLVYLHGAQATDQRDLADAGLRHLARKGFVVLYAEEGTVVTSQYKRFARRAIRAGMKELRSGRHVRPNGQVGYIGFSLGGIVAARLAAEAGDSPTNPRPGVIVLHDPAGECFRDGTGLSLEGEPLTGMAESTRLLIIQAETSRPSPCPLPTGASSNSAALPAWENSPMPRSHKNWLVVPSDDHGEPPMVSDHAASLAPVDAVDWWGYWRPTEGAVAEVFGRSSEGYPAFCNGGGEACAPVRRMGEWSDGRAVTPIRNAGDLGLVP